jgi:hypothetical protein
MLIKKRLNWNQTFLNRLGPGLANRVIPFRRHEGRDMDKAKPEPTKQGPRETVPPPEEEAEARKPEQPDLPKHLPRPTRR